MRASEKFERKFGLNVIEISKYLRYHIFDALVELIKLFICFFGYSVDLFSLFSNLAKN